MRTYGSLQLALIAILVSSFASVGAGAVVQNGSFEDGLNGWTTIGGDANHTGIAFGIMPTNLSNQASLNNSGATATDTAIEFALGLAANRLDVLAGGAPPQAVNGTAIFQTITGVLAGEQLSFNWSFVTNENLVIPQNQDDFAFWSVTDMATAGTVLHRASFALTPTGQPGFQFKSNPSNVTYNFASAGNFILAFGVMNVGDGAGASGLLIDNVVVPEPSSLSLIGLLTLGLVARRRRSR